MLEAIGNEVVQRESFESATKGARSVSEKIRALGAAGYARSEISKLLGIRYQHVRTVLLAAGITGGLKGEVDVPQVPIPVRLPGTVKAVKCSSEFLTDAGFFEIGRWALGTAGGLKLVVGQFEIP